MRRQVHVVIHVVGGAAPPQRRLEKRRLAVPRAEVQRARGHLRNCPGLTAHSPTSFPPGCVRRKGPRTPAPCSSLTTPPTESSFNSVHRARGTPRVLGTGRAHLGK